MVTLSSLLTEWLGFMGRDSCTNPVSSNGIALVGWLGNEDQSSSQLAMSSNSLSLLDEHFETWGFTLDVFFSQALGRLQGFRPLLALGISSNTLAAAMVSRKGGRNLVCPNNFDNSRHSGQEGCDVGAISSELSALEASWYFAMISIGNQGA